MKRRATILVVDDAGNLRRSFSTALELSGYRAVEASSGEEALAKLDCEEISLTLMDVVMPGMGGIETARRIKERDRKHPVILMSGYMDGYIESESLPEGVDAFLKKPIEEKDLLKEIEKGIGACAR